MPGTRTSTHLPWAGQDAVCSECWRSGGGQCPSQDQGKALGPTLGTRLTGCGSADPPLPQLSGVFTHQSRKCHGGGHLVQNFLLTAVWIPCEHLQTQTQGPAHPHRVRPQGNAAQGSAFPKSLLGVCCRQVLMRGASIQGTSHPLGGDSSRLWQCWEEGCLPALPGSAPSTAPCQGPWPSDPQPALPSRPGPSSWGGRVEGVGSLGDAVVPHV